MTVKEIIELLKKCPPMATVKIYEGPRFGGGEETRPVNEIKDCSGPWSSGTVVIK